MEVAYSVFWILFSLSDAAITGTPPNANVCDGEFISLKWAYDTANIFAVEWKINGTLMLQYIPSQPINSQYTYSNGYTSAKLTHITNGEINITSLTTSDNGNYSCQTTYTSGNPSVFETQMVLTIYDMVSTNLTCSYNQSVDTIDCSVTIPSSITAVTINGADYPTSTWPISGTNSATYTVCMAGNAANCRNDGIQQCISFEGRSQSTDSCDFNYCYCIGYILLAVYIASGICTLMVVLWWKIKRIEIKAKSILCWLAEHRFCCCAQKIKSFCEKYKNTRIWGAHVLLLADVLVIGMVVSIVVWLVAVIVVILTCCACKELSVKFAVAGISFLLSLFASPIWTAIVLIVYRIASCCKNNGYHILRSKYKTKEAGDNVNLLEQRAHEFKKIKSIDLTKDGEKVSSNEYEVGMTACPSLTLKMVSLDQSGKYECTISYDLAQKEVHLLNLLVTPKQYEVKMGDKKTLLKFLKNLKDIEDVTWTHNYETIPADTCFYKGGTRSNPSLTMKYCSTSDSGLYICNIRTKQGSKRFSAQLNIKVTDEIKVDVGGKKTLLENLFSNNKDFEYVKWYHKSQPIPHNCDFSYDAEQQNRSALTINLVTAKMEGQYECVVKSTKDAEIKVFKVQVKVLDNYTVDSGKNIDLLKDLSSYHGIKQISWVLNGKPLKLAENPSYFGGTKDRPVLTVHCATKEESGKYTCTLEFESQPTKELNFKLDVNEQWQVDSGDSIVLLDKLDSSIGGTSVVWTHKKKPVKCFHKGGTDQCPALTIPVVSLEDSGEYECKLTLQHGKIRLYRFVLKVNVQKIKKKVGDKVILLQNLTSAGTIQGINWYKNGRKVPASSDLKYQGGVNQSPGLLVGSLRQDDSGRYECDLIITESHIKLHIPVDLTVEQKENSTRLGPVIRNNRVRDSTENNQSWTEEEQ